MDGAGSVGGEFGVDFQQGAFASTVLADDTHHVAVLDFGVDIPQGSHVAALTFGAAVVG